MMLRNFQMISIHLIRRGALLSVLEIFNEQRQTLPQSISQVLYNFGNKCQSAGSLLIWVLYRKNIV